jgi:hypothetical protein
MLRRFLYEDGRMFSLNTNGSVLFFKQGDDSEYQFGMRYRFGVSSVNSFTNIGTGNFVPYLSHSVWFNNYFEYSKVFKETSEMWEWVLEQILFGSNWEEIRQKY